MATFSLFVLPYSELSPVPDFFLVHNLLPDFPCWISPLTRYPLSGLCPRYYFLCSLFFSFTISAFLFFSISQFASRLSVLDISGHPLGPEHTGHFVQPHVAAHCGGDIYSRRKPLFSSFGEHTAVCGSSVRQAVARPRHRQSVCIHNMHVAATCRSSVLGSATMRGHMWLNNVASVLGPLPSFRVTSPLLLFVLAFFSFTICSFLFFSLSQFLSLSHLDSFTISFSFTISLFFSFTICFRTFRVGYLRSCVIHFSGLRPRYYFLCSLFSLSQFLSLSHLDSFTISLFFLFSQFASGLSVLVISAHPSSSFQGYVPVITFCARCPRRRLLHRQAAQCREAPRNRGAAHFADSAVRRPFRHRYSLPFSGGGRGCPHVGDGGLFYHRDEPRVFLRHRKGGR